MLDLAAARYEGGIATSLDVIIAQQALLNSERLAAQLAGQRLLTSVFLVKALGGDWPGTGKVATQSARAILDRHDLELVGLYAFSAEKVGGVHDKLSKLIIGIGRKRIPTHQHRLSPDTVIKPTRPTLNKLVVGQVIGTAQA